MSECINPRTLLALLLLLENVNLGYSENAKAYRVYLPGSRKVVVQWNVKFTEDRAFRKSHEMPAKD